MPQSPLQLTPGRTATTRARHPNGQKPPLGQGQSITWSAPIDRTSSTLAVAAQAGDRRAAWRQPLARDQGACAAGGAEPRPPWGGDGVAGARPWPGPLPVPGQSGGRTSSKKMPGS